LKILKMIVLSIFYIKIIGFWILQVDIFGLTQMKKFYC